MHTRCRVGAGDVVRGVRGWAVWQLPRWLAAFVAAVVLANVAAIGVAAALVPSSVYDLVVAGALLLCTAATVELTKRSGENTGMVKDVYGVWELPLAILLPPVFALSMPFVRLALTQWRIRRSPVYRRVFSGAAVGLSYASASLVFHGMTGTALGAFAGPQTHPVLWVFAVAIAGVVQWTVNTSLLFPALRGGDPSVRVRDLYAGRDAVANDVAELCVAVLVTVSIAFTPVTIVFALPFVTLLQRSFRHAQLLNDSRTDSKTGLLNAGTWEREAASELARAVRTRSPLALALIDIDHFKAVNDVYGHLAGDRALKAVARTLTIALREYDVVGRFGGEEFAVLLPQARETDAYRIAERMRAHVRSMPVILGDNSGAGSVGLTVSIGVVTLDTTGGAAESQLADLLAAADSALYRAKQAGRDQVWMVAATAVALDHANEQAGAVLTHR